MDFKRMSAIEEIEQCINIKQNFLLSGGAGSGKTHTLLETLQFIFNKDINANVACITYTNVAANEIKLRSPYKSLYVSTIHDFLWDIIKNYQKEIKTSIVELINRGNMQKENGISYSGDIEITQEYMESIDKITYREYRKIEEGIISHNEVLKIANYMFKNYPLLCKILSDKYEYIFIDEYQDTQRNVIEIFLDYIEKEDTTIGLFGDKMQAIYDDGIGNIDEYVQNNKVKEIIKEDNYRCSQKVIELLNRVRKDIFQKPSNNNLIGSIKFLYSNLDLNAEEVKKENIFNEWDFSDVQNTKVLYLTNKLLASEQKFDILYGEYSKYYNYDRALGDNKDALIKHLYKIEEIIYLYKSGKYNEFMNKTNFKLYKLEDKKVLKENIDLVMNTKDKTIEEIIDLVDLKGLVKKDDNLNEFIMENRDFYNIVKEIKYEQLSNMYNYEQGYTPYSTQHGVKGAEFDNVYIVLDNGKWTKYNFKYLFENSGNQNVIERTRKIFYVCCSRAMNNLVIYFSKPGLKVVQEAQKIFGEENVKEILRNKNG